MYAIRSYYASGSGKSTLVNMIGGIDESDEGSIIVDGQEISSLKTTKLTNYRRESIGFVFQFYNLISNLTVYENIEVVSDICKNPLNIDDLLETLGIANLAKRVITSYSIHYTKLYEPGRPSADSKRAWSSAQHEYLHLYPCLSLY